MSDTNDLKRLMKEKLGSKKSTINSPLAKYNSAGQLSCLLCNQTIKSDLFWPAHVNSKSHLDKKNQLKSGFSGGDPPQKQQQQQQQQQQPSAKIDVSSSQKNKNVPTPAQNPPKINPPPSVSTIEAPTNSHPSPDTQFNNFKRPASVMSNNSSPHKSTSDLESSKSPKKPKLLDKKIDLSKLCEEEENKIVEDEPMSISSEENNNAVSSKEDESIFMGFPASTDESETTESAETETVIAGESSNLPAGFFDDPDQDAKIRGVAKPSDNLDAEYEMFKKVMQAEEIKSDILVEVDDATRDVNRNIEEVNYLINKWSKIETLHQKREELLAKAKLRKEEKKLNPVKMETNKKKDADSSDDDEDSDKEKDIDLDVVLNLNLRDKKR